MGDVVIFKKSANIFRRTTADENVSGAIILFFTGVRYQRFEHSEALDTGPKEGAGRNAGHTSKKRKRSA